MDKRILTLGCICAVAILLCVSFTSVVGYSSNISNSIESPLYNLRTNRAIENSEDITTCDYVGKGKGLTIPIGENDNLGALKQQLLDKLGEMNEKEIKSLRNSIIRLLNQKGLNKEINNIKQLTPAVDITKDNHFICDIYQGILALVTLIILSPLLLLTVLLISPFVIAYIGLYITSEFDCHPPTSLFDCPTESEISIGCPTQCDESFCVTPCN
jgi:hypothetical protein